MNKKYVKVNIDVDEDGNKKPLSIIYNDRVFQVDKVLEVKPCVSMKVGGIGERYKLKIMGKETYLFYERNRWFVEEK